MSERENLPKLVLDGMELGRGELAAGNQLITELSIRREVNRIERPERGAENTGAISVGCVQPNSADTSIAASVARALVPSLR